MTTGSPPVELDLNRPDAPTIHADVHPPGGSSRGTVLIAHGFLGYKEYGMFPAIARSVVEAGWCGIRFNFAHSGMSRNPETFERTDLFAQSTWNRQVEDLLFLQASIRRGDIPEADSGAPIVLLGHSRGGTAVILAAGRAWAGGEGAMPRPDGVVALAAPADCDRASPEARDAWLSEGFTRVVSNRTGQELRIDRGFLDEIAADPDAHDLEALISGVACPILLAHGADDPTVPASDADRLARAASATNDLRRLRIDGGNHVLNVANPLSPGESSPQLDRFKLAVKAFLRAIDQKENH